MGRHCAIRISFTSSLVAASFKLAYPEEALFHGDDVCRFVEKVKELGRNEAEYTSTLLPDSLQ